MFYSYYKLATFINIFLQGKESNIFHVRVFHTVYIHYIRALANSGFEGMLI